MEQWSTLSNIVNYVHYDSNPRNFYNLDVKTVDQKSHKKIYNKFKEENRKILELDFDNTPDKLREYLDMYEGVQSDILNNTRFDVNSDLSTTYLGRIDMTRASKIKEEVKIPYIR